VRSRWLCRAKAKAKAKAEAEAQNMQIPTPETWEKQLRMGGEADELSCLTRSYHRNRAAEGERQNSLQRQGVERVYEERRTRQDVVGIR